MRTRILTPSALLFVALTSGCGTSTAEAVERPIDVPVSHVAGNCPAGAGAIMHPTGPGAVVDRNHDGYGCVRQGSPIEGGGLFEVDNDAASVKDALQRDFMWEGLYRGM